MRQDIQFIAAEQKGYFYDISDEYYDEYTSFLITSINRIENQGMDGWQYWVNYPDDEIPMIGANAYELSDGDVVSWFYGGYGVNPDTSYHVITTEISIDTDNDNPTATFIKPISGGVYLYDQRLFAILFLSASVLIGSSTIILEAEDSESSFDRISYRHRVKQDYNS